jgi:hypothetical protein
LAAFFALSGSAPAGEPAGLRDVLGVTHVAGAYCRSERDFLNEGADEILSLGSRVIKLYLTASPGKNYPFHAEWPKASSLVDLAQAAYFRSVFAKPFTVYVVTAYSFGRPEHYWRDGLTDEQARDEEEQFYRLARHFLVTYRATGKTFVLQHWEGDWAVRGNYDRKADPTPRALEGMVCWLQSRQRGVDRARAEVGQSGVRVLHAAEVNLVKIAINEDRPTVTTKVLPRTRLDLVSYSAWDGQESPESLRAALDFIARHMPDREPWGNRNVYLGEFGSPENDTAPGKHRRTVRDAARTALDWGCPFVIYWQVYCNEPKRRPVRSNADCRGFWLIRPDGTKAPAWEELRELLAPK